MRKDSRPLNERPLTNAFSAPVAGSLPPRRGLSAVRTVLISIVAVVLVCGGLWAALQLLVVLAQREAAKERECPNNLKRIAFAFHNYAQANNCFPPAYVADKNGKPMYSWRVLILPYVEQNGLFQKFRLDEPWDSPHNLPLASQMPDCFCCPIAFAPGSGSTTCYAMVVGPHAFGNGSKPRTFGEIKDGLPTTIMLVEAIGAKIPWSAPVDIDINDIASIQEIDVNAPGTTKGISGCHRGGAFVVFCDGAICLLNPGIDKKALRAMLTIDGGEKVER
jgi:hypothetical protein